MARRARVSLTSRRFPNNSFSFPLLLCDAIFSRDFLDDAATRAMSRFVYGSLLAPEVLNALLGRVPDRTPATLPGFVRRRIKDAVYPAIYPAEDPSNASVDGEVLTGMSRRELAVLDWFEDEAYVLTRVDVTFDEERERSPPETVEGVEPYLDPSIVMAYVFTSPRDLYGVWDYEEFRREHLGSYVAMCEAFAEDVKHNDLPGDDDELEDGIGDEVK